jgi:hypothetical protein
MIVKVILDTKTGTSREGILRGVGENGIKSEERATKQ